MLNYIRLLKFKDQVTDEDIGELEKLLEALPNSIVEIQMYEFGRNVDRRPDAYDFAITALFANEAALARYIHHPKQDLVREKTDRMCAKSVSVAFFGSDAGSLRERPPADWLLGDDWPH